MRFFLLFFGIGIGGAPLHTTAQAQEETSKKEKATQLAKQGVHAYNAEDYQKSRDCFKEAYRLDPNPKYLPPLGQSYDYLQQPHKAVETYTLFLQKAMPNDPLRAEVSSRLKKSEAVAATVPKPEPEPNSIAEVSAPPPLQKNLFWGAVGAGSLGALTGTLALLPNKGEAADFQKLQARAKRQTVYAVIADISMLGALGAGTAFYLLSKREKKNASGALSITPTSISFSISW